MYGPAPKRASSRARHGTPGGGEWVDLPPLTDPILPALDNSREWSARTVALWEGWRQDFATQMYGPSEIAMAVELAHLVDSAIFAGKVTMWSEALKWMDSLALTPKGKRDARICLDEPVVPGETVVMSRRRPGPAPDFKQHVAMPSSRDRHGPLLDELDH